MIRVIKYLVRYLINCLSTWLYCSGCDLQPRLRNLTGLSGRADFGRDLTGVSGCVRDLSGLSGRDLTGVSGCVRDLTGLSGRDLTGVSGCVRDLSGLSGRDLSRLTGRAGLSRHDLFFSIYRLLLWKSECIILIINT